MCTMKICQKKYSLFKINLYIDIKTVLNKTMFQIKVKTYFKSFICFKMFQDVTGNKTLIKSESSANDETRNSLQ